MTRSIRLGMFVVVGLLILGAAVFIVGDKEFVFTRTYRLQTYFQNVSGLVSGAEIRLGGVRKGTVNDIQLPDRPDQKVRVLMDLEESTRKLIKRDSVVTIETEGLLGNKYLAVAFGNPESPGVREGDTLPSVPPFDFSDLLSRTNDLMAQTAVIMGRAESTMKNVESATAQVDAITAKVNRGQGTIGALVNDRRMYDQINATAGSLRKTVEHANVGVTAFGENMEALKHNWLLRGFFKDRGYFDAAELTRYEIPKLPDGTVMQRFVLEARRIFDKPDTAKLEHEKELNPIGRYLEQHPFGLVVVVAHAGLKGDRDENQILTQARAAVVRQYLAEKFRLDDSRIKTRGMGEDTPESAPDGSTLEVLVYPPGFEKSVASTSAPQP